MKECIFCKIVSGDLPSRKVVETEDILAFYDINPRAPVHVLVIPKKHIVSLREVKDGDKEMLAALLLGAKQVAEKLKIGDGWQIKSAAGAKAGQEVFHLHIHVLGGWKDKQNW